MQFDDGSRFPGFPIWYIEIRNIKRKLNANNDRLIRILEEQEDEKSEEVQPLFDVAESLRLEELLSHMNDTLLDGEGVVKTILRWEEGADFTGEEDDEDWDDEDEELEEEEGRPYLFVVLSVILSWKEAGRIQIKVDIQQEDEGIEMHINGWPVKGPTARNLQSGLVKAFREQMDEDYGKFEEE